MSHVAVLRSSFQTKASVFQSAALPRLAERARAEEWSYERFAEALLATEVASRDARPITA